jgi:hypothetical protein
MNKTATICRGIIVLYLAFLFIITLQQGRDFFGWPHFLGLLLRLGVIGFFAWKTFRGTSAWPIRLGTLLAAVAAFEGFQLYQHSHRYSPSLIRVGGEFVGYAPSLWLFCVLPILGSVACFVLAGEMKVRTE